MVHSGGTKRRRVCLWKIAILTLGIPIFLFLFSLSELVSYVQASSDRIFPNISIDGVDVSMLTRDEVKLALELDEYDSRAARAEISVTFPDGSVYIITGEEAGLRHDANDIIGMAFVSGRVSRLIPDTFGYLRNLNGDGESYKISYFVDTGMLMDNIAEFVENYNRILDGSEPRFYYDRIVFVAGAGQVHADVSDVFSIVLDGLFESLDSGQPVMRTYALPDSDVNMAQLATIWRDILIRPVSAVYDTETKTVSQDVVGVGFDFLDATHLFVGAESGKTVTVDLIYTYPDVTKEYLESILFRDLIGECTTHIAGTSNRLNNVTLAAQAINGHILEPGEEFSFNRIVGRRTIARGYKVAPAISGGQFVPAIGGGICQVSSTLYSAIKDTDLRVTQRQAHSHPIAYLPRGRDATVSWGSIDFRFVNNTEYPLRIDAAVDGRTLAVNVYGTIESEST